MKCLRNVVCGLALAGALLSLVSVSPVAANSVSAAPSVALTPSEAVGTQFVVEFVKEVTPAYLQKETAQSASKAAMGDPPYSCESCPPGYVDPSDDSYALPLLPPVPEDNVNSACYLTFYDEWLLLKEILAYRLSLCEVSEECPNCLWEECVDEVYGDCVIELLRKWQEYVDCVYPEGEGMSNGATIEKMIEGLFKIDQHPRFKRALDKAMLKRAA